MAGQAVAALQAAGEKLLGLVVDAFGAAGVSLPDTRYLPPGELLAWDGEQLTVQLQRLEWGLPGQPSGAWTRGTSGTQSATWVVTLLRGTPIPGGDLTFPDPDDLDVNEDGLLADMVVFLGFTRALVADETLFAGLGEPTVATHIQPLGPYGGLAGSQLTVTHSISSLGI